MGPFDSAWLKWARGVEHAEALQSSINAYADDAHSPPIVPRVGTYDPNRHGFPIAIESVAPIPAQWTLLLGDIAHNVRCALDHAAWSIVHRGRRSGALNDRELRGIYFPIANSRDDFRRMLPGKLPGARRSDVALVRKFQPYARGRTRVQWHCLSILMDIINSDKHREIQEIWWSLDQSHYEVARAADCEVRSIKVWPRCLGKVDAELAFVYVRKTGPKPDVNVRWKHVAYPTFHERLWAEHWIHLTVATTMLVLSELDDPPDEIEALGVSSGFIDACIETFKAMGAIWDRSGRSTPTL